MSGLFGIALLAASLSKVDPAGALFAAWTGASGYVQAEARPGLSEAERTTLEAWLEGPACPDRENPADAAGSIAALFPLRKGSRLTVIGGGHAVEAAVTGLVLDPSLAGAACGGAAYRIRLEAATPGAAELHGLAVAGVLGPKVVVDARHPAGKTPPPFPAALEGALGSLPGTLLALTDLDGDGKPEVLSEDSSGDKRVMTLRRWDGEALVVVKTSAPWGR